MKSRFMFTRNLGRKLWSIPVFLLLFPVIGEAAIYTFSGSSKPTCTGGTWSSSGSTHSCNGSMTLAAGDSILPSTAITIKTEAGALLSGNNTLGSGSVSVNLENNYGGLQAAGTSYIYGNVKNTSGNLQLSGTTVSGTVSNSNGGITLNGGSVQGLVSSGCCAVSTTNTNLSGGASSASSTLTITGGTISGNFSTSGGSGIILSGVTLQSGNITGTNVAVTVTNSTLGTGALPVAIIGNGINLTNVSMPNGSLNTATTPINVTNSSLGTPDSTVSITSGNVVTLKSSTTVYGNVTAGNWNSALDIQDTSAVYGTCSPSHPKCTPSTCSSSRGSFYINEANTKDNWVEIYAKNQVAFSNWTLTACSLEKQGNNFNQVCETKTFSYSPAADGQFVVISFSLGFHEQLTDYLLKDNTGKLVDYFRVGMDLSAHTLQSATAQQCQLANSCNILQRSNNGQRNFARIPDGGCAWNESNWQNDSKDNSNTKVEVVSISRNQPDPAFVGSNISWTVTFSAPVSGVDATDFQLAASDGVTGHSILSVTGSGTTWQVSAFTGSKTGKLGLNLVDNDSIKNGSTPLGGTGNNNGNFTGEVYIVALACASSPVINGTPKMEVGALTLIDTYAKKTPTVVNFTQSFTVPPLVFTLPTDDGDNAGAHRIRNVTKSGFEIMTLEPQGEDGPHVAMAVNFLAIEAGRFVLPDGHKLEACAFPITKAQQSRGTKEWEYLAFQSGFTTNPAVLAQVQTMNNETGNVPSTPSQPWLTSVISNVLPGSMQIALERSETTTGSINTPETMAYFSAEPSNGRKSFIAGTKTIDYEIIRSAAVVKGWNACSTINYSSQWLRNGQPFRPIPLATPNTREGDAGTGGDDDGGWFRRCTENLTNESKRISLAVDEVRTGSTNYDKNRTHNIAERAGIVVFSDNFVTTAVNLHHIEIHHPATGLTCSPSDITLKACSDAACNTLYTGSVTLSLTPASASSNWLGTGVEANQVVFTGGSATVQLSHTANSTVTLGASGTPTAPNPLVCKRSDGSISNCQMTFSSSGAQLSFIPPSGDRMCARTENWTLKAESCGSANWNNKTKKIRLWFNYDTPTTGSDPVTLNGTNLPSTDPGTGNGINLSFNGSGIATLSNLGYASAGKIKLSAQYTGSTATGDAGENRNGEVITTFRPFAIWITADSGTCTTTPASDCAKYAVAGEPFALRAKAVCWQAADDANGDGIGDANANLGNNALAKGFVAADLELQVEKGDASLDQNANFLDSTGAIPTDPPKFNMPDNDESINNLRIDDTGAFRFTASGPYLGTTIPAIAGSGSLIGRFIPARFNTEITQGCSDFTYSGQFFKIKVSALDLFNHLTENYAGNWARDLTLSDANTNAGSFAPASVTADKFSSGTINPASDVKFTFTNKLTAPSTIKVRTVDSDGVSSATGSEGTTLLRSGRLRLSNAFGTVANPPPMAVRTQYWSGNSWIAVNDTCTLPTTALFTVSPNKATPTLNTSGAVGPWQVRFSAISQGSADVCANLATMPWLQNPGDPCAKVTFGIYPAESRRTVHTRELY